MSSNDYVRQQMWTVCFAGATRKHWVQRFLKDGFEHCYAFTASPGGKFFMLVDPIRSYTMLDLLPADDDTYKELTEGVTFVNVVATIDIRKDRGHFCRINCVEVIKSFLGINSFFTLTPYQLYKRLKNG